MLSIGGNNIYQRSITDGLWTILSRARKIAATNKKQLIKNGYKLTLPIKGKPKGESPITFVIYHVPFEASQDKSIGSFDVPTIDHSKIKHLELVRWTIKAGVTARFAPNLMPINEGVIICESHSQECINFFAHYMGTYEAIKDDKKIQSVTGNDLMRWRGGQLSLNAVCPGSKMLDARDSCGWLKILPCNIYNYAVMSKAEVNTIRAKNRAYFAHIKGKAKIG